MKNLLVILVILFSALGCNSTNETNEHATQLNDKDAELFESILRSRWSKRPKDDKRTFYLTCTPQSDWENGHVEDFPDSFYQRISDLPFGFRKASEAVYVGDVFFKDRETGNSACMVWISINKWISETEVEVEHGMWYQPLRGHGDTFIYIKVNGKWKLKKPIKVWIS